MYGHFQAKFKIQKKFMNLFSVIYLPIHSIKHIDYYQHYQLEDYPIRTQKMIKRLLNRIHYNLDDSNAFQCTPRHIETSNWETLAYLIKSRFRVCILIC